MNLNKIAVGLLLTASSVSVLSSCQNKGTNECTASKTVCTANKTPYQKKYTNADYYKDGKFQPEVALQAYIEMFDHYGVQYNDFLKENMFISDFNQGDFENVGMAGVFWQNNPTAGYVGHNIYLLPGQAIVEHAHMATSFPAKMESWYVEHGSAYNFGVGEETPNAPVLAESQANYRTVKNHILMNVGDTASLTAIETPHFLMAGPNGAVVLETGNYHDGSGLKFTNPSVEFVDALTEMKTKALALESEKI